MPKDNEKLWDEYNEAFQRVRDIDPPLAGEFDAAAMNIKNAEVDQARIEALEGAEISGTLAFTGGDGPPDITVRFRPVVVGTSPLNPSFDDCLCGWGRAEFENGVSFEERWVAEGTKTPDSWNWGVRFYDIDNGARLHEMLLGLDGPRPLEALDELLVHMDDSHIPSQPRIEQIFAQHNWSDPVGAQHLSQTLETVLERIRATAETDWVLNNRPS